MAKKYTHCDICLAACGMEVEVEDNRIVDLRGDKDHPLTRGFLCPKGMVSHEMVEDPLRLRHPYERVGPEWKPISWAEAYGKISRRLRTLIEKHGPHSIALYYGGGNATSSVNYMLADGFLRALGSDRLYNVLTLEFTNRYLVMEKMYGKPFFVTQPDMDRTDCLLIFGSNPMVSLDHPGIVGSLKDLKKRGGKLFVVDPRKTETARMADVHVDILPGTDLFMLLAMHAHIFRKGLENREFLERHCAGREHFQQLPQVNPEDAARLCGVSAGAITRIAETFATAGSACAVCKLGVNVSRNCTLTYWLVEALNAVTGNVDRPGGLLFNPGILDLNLLSKISAGWKRRKSRIGGYPYLTNSYPASELSREILMDSSDRIRGLIVDAGDPSLLFPNASRFEEAAEKLDLLVSIDTYMNETAQKADFVLPAANFFEKDDLYILFPDHFPYPFAQWKHKVVNPPDGVKPEWEIFRDLSRHMGVPILNQWPMEWMFRGGEFLGTMTGTPTRFAFDPKNYYRLLLGGLGKVKFGRLMKNPHGVKVADIRFGAALKRMATPSKKIELAPAEFVEALKRVNPPPEGSDRFPLVLITGERSPHTKNTQLRGVTSLTKTQSSNFLRISNKDAAFASVKNGDLVEVSTPHGKATVRVRVTDDIRPGVVSLTHGWGRRLFHPETRPNPEQQGVSANLLTVDENLDELCGMPVYNAIPCRVCRKER
jgi:anaerobic selenocysteine-containing dehydrogenase